MAEFVDPREDKRTLRILTYNVGLLRVMLFGVLEVWGNPPYSTQRLPLIPAKLKAMNADIIAIQGASLLLLPSFLFTLTSLDHCLISLFQSQSVMSQGMRTF